MRPNAATAFLFVVALAACEGSKGASAESAGCTKDTDCKGDRICESGRCIAPPAAAANVPAMATSLAGDTAAAPSLVKVRVNAAPDSARVSEDGVELCTTPCEILYKGADADPGREHKLALSRQGYKVETRTLKVGDSPLAVKLAKALESPRFIPQGQPAYGGQRPEARPEAPPPAGYKNDLPY